LSEAEKEEWTRFRKENYTNFIYSHYFQPEGEPDDPNNNYYYDKE